MDYTLPIGSTANAISSANCLTKCRALIGDVPVLFVFDLFNKLKGLAFNCTFSIIIICICDQTCEDQPCEHMTMVDVLS